MIANAKNNKVGVPRAKIARAVEIALPKGRPFSIHVQNSQLGGMKVVRVVTPAWKNLRPAERIFRVREEVEKRLTAEEKNRILRFSVLTPGEYRRIFGVSHERRVPHRASPAKRKAAKASARRKKPSRNR